MKQMILTQFPWMGLSSFALLIFFTLFVVLIFRLNTKTQKNVNNLVKNLPLEDGVKYEQR